MDRKPVFDAVGRLVPGIWNVPGAIERMDALLDLVPAQAVMAQPFPISAITADLLQLAAPLRPLPELAIWAEPLREACAKFEINTIRRVAAFITTLAHEGGFRIGVRENMNYSADRLMAVWPKRFRGSFGRPNSLANSLHRKPEAIANIVYANRMGNGPPESGDGWRFRGNGPLQLTGRANHEAFAKAMGMPLDQAVEWIGTLEGGIMSAAWFWEANDINRLADSPGVADETRRINGGEIGLAERTRIFNRLVDALLKIEASL